MDYDDNDFQSHNIHLGGEGSTKYPSVSQTYALPRFDFDDSLQGNLRFDSLVYSDLFLGIGSNEDNQWIEDFSRGNSAVGFNSTGADTFILRRRNVWSEATSSESVEMLLKSVGQREINPSQRTTNDSVSCYELGSLTGQMETKSNIGSDILSKPGDSTESDQSHPMLTSHDFPDNPSGMNEDNGGDDVQVHCSSHSSETYLDGHNSALNIDAVSDKEIASASTEGNLLTAEQFSEKDKENTNILNDKLVDNCEEDFSASVVQVDNKFQCNTEMESRDVSHQSDDKSEKKAEGTEGRCLENVVQHHHPCDKDHVVGDDQNLDWNRDESGISNLEPPRSGSTVEPVSEDKETMSEDKETIMSATVDAVGEDKKIILFTTVEPVSEDKETIMSTMEPCSVTAKDDPLLHMPDDCRKFICSTAPQDKDGESDDLSIDVQMSAKSGVYMHQVSSAPEARNPDRRVEEDSNKKYVKCATPTLAMDSPPHMRCSIREDYLLYSSIKSNTERSVIEPDKCLSEAGKTLDTYHGEIGSSNSREEGISSLMLVHSSAEPHIQPPAFGVANDVSVICGDVKEPRATEASSLSSGFEQKCEQSGQADSVKWGNSGPMIVEEGSELSAGAKNDSKNSGIEGDVDKEAHELKPQHHACNETVQITHMSEAISTVHVSLGASLPRPALSSFVSLQERVTSGNIRGERHVGSQSIVAVDAGSKKIHQEIMAIETNQGSNQEMEVSPAMFNSEVEEGNLTEVPASLGRLEDAIGQVNNEEVSQVAVQINHTSEATSTAQVSSGASLSSPALSPSLSLLERVTSVNFRGDRHVDSQSLVAVDSGSKKIHQDILATVTNQETEVPPAFSNAEVEEGNLAEVPASLGRLEDPIGRVNNEGVSQLAGDVSKYLEGPSGPAVLREFDANGNSHAGKNNAACDSPIVFKSIDLPQSADKTEECRVSGDDGAVTKENDESCSHAKLNSLDNGNSHAENNSSLCDSLTVFKSIELPQLADKTEECRVDGDNSAEVAKENDEGSSKALSIPQCLSGNDASRDGDDFTFEQTSIASVTETVSGRSTVPASTSSAGIVPQMVGETSTSPCLGQSDINTSHDISRESPQQPAVEVVRGGSKGMSERKSRRSSSKENAKRGKAFKETTPVRQSEKGKKSVNTSLTSSGVCSPMHPAGLHLFGNVECSSGKTFGVFAAPTPSVPVLNTSAPALHHKPFTDLQQVRLRAQILVYGALIQGTVPDEACMVSAFGGSDGGRNIWENAWCTSLERLQSQKLHTIIPETPPQSHLGSRVSDQPNNSNSTSVGRAGSRGTPSSIVNPMIPLSSPLWTYPTLSGDIMQPSGLPRGPVFDYKQSISPLPPYQVPPISNLVGQNASWISQATFHGPWASSPQTSGPDSSFRFPTYPPSELIQSTPVKESSVPLYSWEKHTSAAPVIQSGPSGSILMSTSPTIDINKMFASTVQQPGSKARKRKKAPISEDPDKTSMQPHSDAEMVSTPSSSHPSVSLGTVIHSGLDSKFSTENIMTETSSVKHTRELLGDGEQRVNLSEEILGKIKKARVQAENAAETAAASTNHCQELWRDLFTRSTRLLPNIEEELSSAAAAIAAAACVAKAAAAAANVASNAALQAKLMAEEALLSSGYMNDLSGDMNNANSTPVSILKRGNGAQTSNSPIFVAKEAARRRIDAATAASKQAENIDAIVKAAELTAAAVSYAGRIVAMGNPLKLAVLAKSGPEGYWKSHLPPDLACNLSECRKEHAGIGNAGEAPEGTENHRKQGAYVNEDHMPGFTAASKNDGQNSRNASDTARTTGVVPESVTATRTSFSIQNDNEIDVQTLMQSTISEGCHVEVLREGDGSAAWHQAKVAGIQDGKAFVCYTELKLDDGPGGVKEWVSLNGENAAPRIRIARPMVATQFEGRKKRRRVAMGDYNWSVGDRVDAWIQDRWREGIVTKKSKKDNTTFSVQFPEQTCDVKAWHLRTSLVWRNGKWIEWSQSRGKHSSPHESYSPLEKRRKMGTPPIENGKDKMPINDDSRETGKAEDIRLLDLAANEKIFSMGKSNRDEKKHVSLRTLGTNLQKGGSGVVFGVPKPGKKRKFMEVSKHYDSDLGTKSRKENESTKFSKYLMPQGSGSQGSKGTAKSSLKEIRGAVTKPKIPKSGKSHGAGTRNIIHKDKDHDTSVSASGEEPAAEHNGSIKISTSHDHNTSGNHGADGSAAGGSFVFSSAAVSSEIPSRRAYLSNKSGRASKGKLAPAGAKLAKVKEDSNRSEANSSSEVVEPRRSNRRIQPTSRLLEGLQSSFISKIPFAPHDRSHRNISRGSSRG